MREVIWEEPLLQIGGLRPAAMSILGGQLESKNA